MRHEHLSIKKNYHDHKRTNDWVKYSVKLENGLRFFSRILK